MGTKDEIYLNTLLGKRLKELRKEAGYTEIAMLQVLGFSRGAVIFSLVQESILTVAAGALPALVVAIFLLDGAGVRFSMGVFSLSVDATCVASGLGAGLLLGLVGSLPPTIRCLRTSIPTALKSDLV